VVKRRRAQQRAEDREAQKLARDLEKLADLSEGGSPERAIRISSPAEVEVQASATRCPVCQGELRVEEHTAETLAGARVRVARVVCAVCRRKRAIYFRLAGSTLN
jgi:uncharacterized protein with PIN domain